MHSIYKEFGQRLSILRKENKWTQSEVAAKLNTVQSTYSGYELGTRKVTLDTIIALATIFDVPPDYLILGNSLPPNNLENPPQDKIKKELLFIYDQELNSKGQEQLLKQARYYKTDPDYKKAPEPPAKEVSLSDDRKFAV